jgi:hypothetical protein
MTDRINLEERAENAISEALYGMKHYDASTLRNALEDRAHEEAESACIYHHWCAQIIQDYEREHGEEADDMGGTYTASQWQEAQTAYAYGIASAALSTMISTRLDEIEEAADDLSDLCRDAAGEQFDGDLTIGAACPHGWAPHDREDENGTHFWSPAHLEGCHAIARQVCGVWLSFTWTPAPVELDEPAAA